MRKVFKTFIQIDGWKNLYILYIYINNFFVDAD